MLWFSFTLLHLYCNYRLVVNISCQSNTRNFLDYYSYNCCKYDSNSILLLFTRRKMMVKDSVNDDSKKIHSISYNILNLPSEVKFDDGHIIRYTYDAAGTKLKAEYQLSNERFMDWDIDGPAMEATNALSTEWSKGVDIGGIVVPPGSEIIMKPVTLTTLQYSAGHVYRNGKLERVDNPYGYWANGSFHYHITDYQGSIRAVIDENGTLEEINHYSPNGGLMGAGAMGV